MPEKDRARDAVLTKRGWTVRRIPMEQGATAAQVATAIGRVVNAHARRRTVAA
jgi:very-short-patch-repair endonuclease